MGLINECMLNSQKQRIPSEVGDIYHIPNDINYYRKTYQNTSRYNDYLDQQCYRTMVIEPSQKNSSVYQKMNNCSQPPSEVFHNLNILQLESHAIASKQQIKIRRTNQTHSQTVNRPKISRRSAQPLSYQPMKPSQKQPNVTEQTFETEL